MWIVHPAEIMDGSTFTGKWRIIATNDEGGRHAAPHRLCVHHHASAQEAIECEDAQTEAQLYGGVWEPPLIPAQITELKAGPLFLMTHSLQQNNVGLVCYNAAVINPYEVISAEKSEFQRQLATFISFKNGSGGHYSETLLKQLTEYAD